MSDPSLAMQQLIRARLSASTDVTALVPATAIADRNHRPETFPAIIFGDGRATFADNVQDSFHDEAFTDLHIWVKEDGLATGKAIADAVKDALSDGPWSVDGYRAINVRVVNARYMRDPNGQFSHTVLSVEALLIEIVS